MAGQADHIMIIGAGAAGLMAARELGRAGKRVTILEARDRCGGRIAPLSADEFGYRADGGAEFVHGEAPVTRGLLGEAGLSLAPVNGARWTVRNGTFARDEMPERNTDAFYRVLSELTSDMTVTALLDRYFAGPDFASLRQSVVRTVMGYDAADPDRASVLALRDEWMHPGRGELGRIVGGYGALIDFLLAECREHGADIRLQSSVIGIETTDDGVLIRCAEGSSHRADAAILAVPLPLLQEIALPRPMRDKVTAAAQIGFGNVIKLLLRFESRWWTGIKAADLSDLLFVLSDVAVPVWWTQRPTEHAVLTGWLAGPPTSSAAQLDESQLIETGLGSLAQIFGLSLPQLKAELVAARAINWGNDPFSRGAYSYATLATRRAQAELASWDGGAILLSGEALYQGRDMGTVEAALSSGLDTARMLLGD
ncbi:flavin monoamine oxidase family protein [Bradyrhizobium sp. STM 3557]|uniref:flavin monoamine oxidase family protein n=1 Tax=Bradyrhizobium sp. STM 3557 TaxID=578920 RepID=UPI0038910C3E